jgi:hypothetical protein
LPDRRVILDQQMNTLKEQLSQRLAGLLEDRPDVAEHHQEIVARLVDIRQAWHAMRHQALRVGRALLRIRCESPPAYDAIVREPGMLPFGENVAKKLRLIAEAVEGGRIGEDMLPSHYSVAYEVVTLRDEELRVAMDRGLLRPQAERAEVLRFKAEIRGPTQNGTAVRLRRRRERLLEELREIEARLHQLEKGL